MGLLSDSRQPLLDFKALEGIQFAFLFPDSAAIEAGAESNNYLL